jgi:hypothetical protein
MESLTFVYLSNLQSRANYGETMTDKSIEINFMIEFMIKEYTGV